MNLKLFCAALLVATTVHAASALAPVPAGWTVMGNGGPNTLPGQCELGVDNEMTEGGKPNFTIRCASEILPSFGGLVQRHNTSQYRGKRVRYSAWLKGENISDMTVPPRPTAQGTAGIYFSVSTSNGYRIGRTEDRVFKGTTGWEQFDFVVDVPMDNTAMFTGVWMQGKGQLWFRDLKIEEVPLSVPATFFMEDPKRRIGPDLSLQ